MITHLYRYYTVENKVIIKTVGYGTAASNIGPMGNTLHVIVHEWHSMYDGPINVSVDVLESKTVDSDGKTHHDKIQSTQTVHATWMPSGSNRLTAPNIRVGERVEILQESDTSTYYWRSVGLDEKQRTLETIIWGISATEDDSADVMDPDNRYWIEFSSHSKKIVLTTSAKNGEKARYCISIDGGEGIFNIMDDKGNFASLDSNIDNWKIATVQGSFVEIDKQDININAVNNLDAKVGNNMTVKVGNNMSMDVGNSASVKASDVSVDGSSSTVIKGGGSTMTFTSGGIVWSAPTFTGN